MAVIVDNQAYWQQDHSAVLLSPDGGSVSTNGFDLDAIAIVNAKTP